MASQNMVDELAASKIFKKMRHMKIDFVETLRLEILKPDGSLKTTAELDLLKNMMNLDVNQALPATIF